MAWLRHQHDGPHIFCRVFSNLGDACLALSYDEYGDGAAGQAGHYIAQYCCMSVVLQGGRLRPVPPPRSCHRRSYSQDLIGESRRLRFIWEVTRTDALLGAASLCVLNLYCEWILQLLDSTIMWFSLLVCCFRLILSDDARCLQELWTFKLVWWISLDVLLRVFCFFLWSPMNLQTSRSSVIIVVLVVSDEWCSEWVTCYSTDKLRGC